MMIFDGSCRCLPTEGKRSKLRGRGVSRRVKASKTVESKQDGQVGGLAAEGRNRELFYSMPSVITQSPEV